LRRIAAAFAVIALLGASSTTVERIGRTRAAIVLPDAKAIGSVILIPGGNTLLTIDDRGGTDSGNFVIRTRQAYVDAGFAIAFLDDPSDLGPIIARMRAVARPVFLLGTSNGTAVAAISAARLGADGPDGVVLTSTVTRGSGLYPYSAASADFGRIAIPVLFVDNRNDDCRASPPSGVAGLMARLPKGADVTRIEVSSARTTDDPCGPWAPHGYLGIESDVVAKIISWMRAHGAQGAG
jgi:hypothetical protein